MARAKPTATGRPPFEPTPEQRIMVAVMAESGVSHRDICTRLRNPTSNEPIDAATLRKHFREELTNGKQIANASVKMSLFQKATSGKHPQAVTAAIFWLKTQAGWREDAGQTPDDPKGSAAQIRADMAEARQRTVPGRVKRKG